MKYHVYGGCSRHSETGWLTRAEFNNTLSSQRCRACERKIYGDVGARAAAVARGEMIEAREGETLRLSRGAAEKIKPRRRPIFDFLETPLLPILETLCNGSGPGRLADALAKIAEDRAQARGGMAFDRGFWLDTARAFGTAAAAIDAAADAAARPATDRPEAT